MNQDNRVLAIAAVFCAVAVTAVVAQNKVQGVKWHAKVTMQSKSVNLPERTMDICLPATDPDQAALQQGQQQSNCKMVNVKRSAGSKSTPNA